MKQKIKQRKQKVVNFKFEIYSAELAAYAGFQSHFNLETIIYEDDLLQSLLDAHSKHEAFSSKIYEIKSCSNRNDY